VEARGGFVEKVGDDVEEVAELFFEKKLKRSDCFFMEGEVLFPDIICDFF